MAYRSGYGVDAFGTELFGVTGAIDASVSASCSGAVSVSAERVRDGSAAVGGSAAASVPNTQIIKDGSASIVAASVFVSVAEEYAVTDGYRTGYGLRTFGSSQYGRNDVIAEASATASCAASVSVSFERVQSFSATAACVSDASARGVFDVVGSSAAASVLSVALDYERILSFSATSSAALQTAFSGRKKWEDEADPLDTWTDATNDDNVAWTNSPVRIAA